MRDVELYKAILCLTPPWTALNVAPKIYSGEVIPARVGDHRNRYDGSCGPRTRIPGGVVHLATVLGSRGLNFRVLSAREGSQGRAPCACPRP